MSDDTDDPASEVKETWSRRSTVDHSPVRDIHTYLRNVRPKWLRPAVWRRADIEAKLGVVEGVERAEADRTGAYLHHGDTEETGLYGTTSTLYVAVLPLRPGEHMEPHRHNMSAVYLVLKGTGHSIVEHVKIEWEAGDVFLCPPYAYHEHANTGDEPAWLYVVQDSPLVSYLQAGIWEEPAGVENTLHLVQGQIREAWLRDDDEARSG